MICRESSAKFESHRDRLALLIVFSQIGSLYAEKYEEEFRPYVPNWVSAVYQLLITVGSVMLPRHDPVMIGALHFMTQIVSRPWNKHLFAEPDRLRAICESIIMPNLTLQQQDIAMFYHNPIEYVRRDSEGCLLFSVINS